jgi:hypothetical protein
MDSQGMKNAKKMLEKFGWSEGIISFDKIQLWFHF